jgi:hypothetical protein
MNWMKGILSGLAAVSLSLLLPILGAIPGLKAVNEEHASGVGLVLGGFLENLSSPRFWILTLLFFVTFLATSRLGNKILRFLLFWVPVSLATTLGLILSAFFASAFLASRWR